METSIKKPILYAFIISVTILVAINIYAIQWMHFTLERLNLEKIQLNLEQTLHTLLSDKYQQLDNLLQLTQLQPELTQAFASRDHERETLLAKTAFSNLYHAYGVVSLSLILPNQQTSVLFDLSSLGKKDASPSQSQTFRDPKTIPEKGLLLDPSGHIEIHVTKPWQTPEGKTIGAMAMGMDITPLLQELKHIAHTDLYAFVPKDKVDRPAWEADRKNRHPPQLWDQFGPWILAAATQTSLPPWLNASFIINPRFLIAKEESSWWNGIIEHDHFLKFVLRDDGFHNTDSPNIPAPLGWIAMATEDLEYDILQVEHILTIFLILLLVTTLIGLLFYRLMNGVERKIEQSVHDLHTSEVRHATILDTTLDAFISIDEHGTILEFNRAAETTLGYIRSEIIGHSLSDFLVPPHLRAGHERGLQKLRDSSQGTAILNRRIELPVLHKNGHTITCEVAISAFSRGRSTCFSAFLRDISDKKIIDQRLNLQSTALEAAANPILITDNQGVIQWTNPAFTRLTGYLPEEVNGKKPNLLKSGQHDGTFYNHLWQTILAGDVWHHEFVNKKKDGSFYIQETTITPVRHASGLIQHFIAIQQDITDKKRIENERNRFWLAVEQSPVTTLITDPEGIIEYVNPQFCRTTGYNQDEAIGRNPGFLEAIDDSLTAFTDMRLTSATNKLWRGELLSRRKNGEQFWESTLMAPIFNDFGHIQHFLLIKEDITEKKAYETNLKEARTRAEAASLAKSKFLATMSHEIRTPMNGLLGMMDLLLDTALNNQQRQYAQTVYRSGESLLTLLNDILDFSRIESNQIRLEPKAMDLGILLDDVVGMMAPLAQSKGLSLEITRTPADMPTAIKSDPVRLRQILGNLLGNAIKFTETGGVTVHLSHHSTSSSAMVVHFVIQDTGIGIDESTQSDLFHPFVQADSTTTRRFGGSGLGLSIVGGLIELMGGKLGLESVPGQGSTFWFEIPVTRVRADAVAASEESIPTQEVAYRLLRSTHILVAEDFEVNRNVILGMLGKLGCTVDWVENGRKAVEMVATGRHYDLILMDLHMPEMDGLTAAAHIRKLQSTLDQRRIPIIAVTADAMSGDREKCLAAGLDDYLAKPYRMRDLVRTINIWLPGHIQTSPMHVSASPPQVPDISAPGAAKVASIPLSIIDNKELGRLHSEVGDELDNIIRVFLRVLPERVHDIVRAAHDDPISLADKAHRLKGGAKTLGALQLADLCQQLEKLGKSGGSMDAVPPLLEQLEDTAKHTEALLRAGLAEEYAPWRADP